MKSNLMQLFEKKLFSVNRSYHESFKHLSNEELLGLCDHNSLLGKVHEELKSSITESYPDYVLKQVMFEGKEDHYVMVK